MTKHIYGNTIIYLLDGTMPTDFEPKVVKEKNPKPHWFKRWVFRLKQEEYYLLRFDLNETLRCKLLIFDTKLKIAAELEFENTTFSNSSLALKQGLFSINLPRVVDCDLSDSAELRCVGSDI